MLTHRLSSLSRLQAFGFHFLASATVIAVIFGLVKLVWYPNQLFEAANGFELLKILVLVDLVLGPLVMLIIFNPKKKSLKFDVSTVLICQVVFMAYGVWSLFTVRPVYIAYVENQFFLVKANEIEDSDLDKVEHTQFKNLPLFGPVFVGTKAPESDQKREEIMFARLGGMGIQNLPQYYVPIEDVQTQVRANSKILSQLNTNSEDKKQLENLLAKAEKQGQKLLFSPLQTKGRQLFVAVDAASGQALRVN